MLIQLELQIEGETFFVHTVALYVNMWAHAQGCGRRKRSALCSRKGEGAEKEG